MAQNVIAMFPDLGHAEAVVADLLQSGVKRERISIVSHDASEHYRDLATLSDEQRKQKALQGLGGGALLGAATGAIFALGVSLVPGLWIIGAGPLAAILGGGGVGAAVGAAAGGIGAALDRMGIPEGPAQRYAEALRRGGTMIAIEVPDDQVKRVASIVERHDPIDLDRSAKRWSDQGWRGYDAKSAPLDAQEAEQERRKFELDRRAHGKQPEGYDPARDPDRTYPPVIDEGAAVGAPPAAGRVRSYPIEHPVTGEEEPTG